MSNHRGLVLVESTPGWLSEVFNSEVLVVGIFRVFFVKVYGGGHGFG